MKLLPIAKLGQGQLGQGQLGQGHFQSLGLIAIVPAYRLMLQLNRPECYPMQSRSYDPFVRYIRTVTEITKPHFQRITKIQPWKWLSALSQLFL